jgi:hypothetical protein
MGSYPSAKNRAVYTRGWRASRRYVSREVAIEYLDAQEGLCAICQSPIDESAHLDHDHETGEIRGMLCGNCNMGIGHLKDSPAIVGAALSYLASAQTKEAHT